MPEYYSLVQFEGMVVHCCQVHGEIHVMVTLGCQCGALLGLECQVFHWHAFGLLAPFTQINPNELFHTNSLP